MDFGFIIADAKGIEVFVTKSGLYNLYIQPAKLNQRFECWMKVPSMLTPGICFPTVAVAPEGETESGQTAFYDARFDALRFQVIGQSRCHASSLLDHNAARALTSR